MAGLNNFISNTATQSTTLPDWYDTASQKIATGATDAMTTAPKLADTTAGVAINQLNDPNKNPFTQSQSTLNSIATGAANPWITDASGNVTPNTSTAMGGLFQAQNQQLNQLMPSVTAPAEAGAIGSGAFGSLRGQTAVQKAKGDAYSQMLAAQMQAALQNQQTGANAARSLGDVGAEGTKTMMDVGAAEKSDPFFNASAASKILGGLNTATTTSNTTKLSPLNQIGSILSATGGSVAGADKFLKSMGVKGGLSEFLKASGVKLGGGLGTPGVDVAKDPETAAIAASGGTPMDDEGNLNPGWKQNADGTYSYDKTLLPSTPDLPEAEVVPPPDVPEPDVPVEIPPPDFNVEP
jgi:hypothetical protein